MKQKSSYSVVVTERDRVNLNASLDFAIQTAVDYALADQSHGVLVTRHDPATYFVEISDEVPFGVTHERDLYVRRPQAGSPTGYRHRLDIEQ